VGCWVQNQGQGSTCGSSTLKYYLSTNYTYSTDDIYLDNDPVGALAPGEISSENATLTIPPCTAAGFYYIVFYADADNVIVESNENNNTNWVSFSVTSPTYTISTSSNPSNGGSTSGGGTYANCQSCTVIATPTPPCYQFVNWKEGTNVVSNNSSYTFTVNSNRNLVAYFQLISYTVTTSSNPSNGGTTTGGGNYPCNSSVTVTATPSTCYQFVSWTENGNVVSNSPSYTFTITGNRNLVANFDGIVYIVTTSINLYGCGTVTGGGSYSCNGSVTVTAYPCPCYQFVSWTENGNVISNNASYTFTIIGNRNLVVNFQLINNTVDTSSNPSGGGSTTGGGSYPCNSSVTLKATPNTDYQFNKWTENGTYVSSDSIYIFTITTNRNLVANFLAIPIGLRHVDLKSKFIIYPNPTSGRFTLELNAEPGETPITMTILNMMGTKISETLIHAGKIHELTLENQAQGIYLVKVENDREIYIMKVIKMN